MVLVYLYFLPVKISEDCRENSFSLSLAPGKGWKQLIVVIGRGYQLRPKQ